MIYQDRFQSIDTLITHLDSVLINISDHFIKAHYAGFLSVSVVTVYELAIKDILYSFSYKKHKVFGNFAAKHFERINGRIKIKDLLDDHLDRFGEKYSERFKKKLTSLEKKFLKSNGISVKSSYGNIITWRHSFAHQGNIPATYEEVKQAYINGKLVINCLSETMRK